MKPKKPNVKKTSTPFRAVGVQRGSSIGSIPVCGYGPRGVFLRKLGTVGVTCIVFVLALSRSGLIVPQQRLDGGGGGGGNIGNNHRRQQQQRLTNNQEVLEFQRQDEVLIDEQQQQQQQQFWQHQPGVVDMARRETGGGGGEVEEGSDGENNGQVFEQQQQQQQQQRSIENDLNSFVVDSSSTSGGSSHVGDGGIGGSDSSRGDGLSSDGSLLGRETNTEETEAGIETKSEFEFESKSTLPVIKKASMENAATAEEEEQQQQNEENESILSVSFLVSEKVDGDGNGSGSGGNSDGSEADDNHDELDTEEKAGDVSSHSIEIEDVVTTAVSAAEAVEEEEQKTTGTPTDSVEISNRPLVCSHQLLNPPPRRYVKRKPQEDKNDNDNDNDTKKGIASDGSSIMDDESYSTIVPDGSLQAMTLFWDLANITCYDIDVVVLRDGSLLASHPNRLRAALVKSNSTGIRERETATLSNYTTTTTTTTARRQNSTTTGTSTAETKLKTSRMSFDDDDSFNRYLRTVTLDELRSVGISSDSFPLLDDDILPHFSKLLRRFDDTEEEMDRGRGSIDQTIDGSVDGASGHDSKTLDRSDDPSYRNPPESKNKNGDDSKTVNTVDIQDGAKHVVLNGNITKTALKKRSLSSLKKKKRKKSHTRRMLLEESHSARNDTDIVDKSIAKDDGSKNGPSRSKAVLSGPHINLDLKQGPYLTKDVLKRVVDKIYDLQLEDHVAICVTPLDDENYTDDESSRDDEMNGGSVTSDPSKPKKEVPLDMLRILVSDDESFYPSEEKYHTLTENETKKHNLRGHSSRRSNSTVSHDRITSLRTRRSRPMLGLVLRDLVVEDRNVARIHRLVEKYPESIRLLVPSFKFQESWYKQLRENGVDLPMTVWTIDSNKDFDYAARMNVSAVIANNPFEFLKKDDNV